MAYRCASAKSYHPGGIRALVGVLRRRPPDSDGWRKSGARGAVNELIRRPAPSQVTWPDRTRRIEECPEISSRYTSAPSLRISGNRWGSSRARRWSRLIRWLTSSRRGMESSFRTSRAHDRVEARILPPALGVFGEGLDMAVQSRRPGIPRTIGSGPACSGHRLPTLSHRRRSTPASCGSNRVSNDHTARW